MIDCPFHFVDFRSMMKRKKNSPLMGWSGYQRPTGGGVVWLGGDASDAAYAGRSTFDAGVVVGAVVVGVVDASDGSDSSGANGTNVPQQRRHQPTT